MRATIFFCLLLPCSVSYGTSCSQGHLPNETNLETLMVQARILVASKQTDATVAKALLEELNRGIDTEKADLVLSPVQIEAFALARQIEPQKKRGWKSETFFVDEPFVLHLGHLREVGIENVSVGFTIHDLVLDGVVKERQIGMSFMFRPLPQDERSTRLPMDSTTYINRKDFATRAYFQRLKEVVKIHSSLFYPSNGKGDVRVLRAVLLAQKYTSQTGEPTFELIFSNDERAVGSGLYLNKRGQFYGHVDPKTYFLEVFEYLRTASYTANFVGSVRDGGKRFK